MYKEFVFSEIKGTDKNGIEFKSGEKIVFADCIGRRYKSLTCVAERDITALPPYFEFFTYPQPTRIVFSQKGIFSKSKNRKEFINLQMKISHFGYSTYDLS